MAETSALSRPLVVDAIPGAGVDVTVEAGPEERERLARDFRLPAVEALVGRFRVEKRGRTVHVDGAVEARVVQTCVVTLEPFPAEVREPVSLKFAETLPVEEADENGEHEARPDAPDPIVGGRIDLGAVTAEFLALGLDPYPRKPGADFRLEERGGGREPVRGAREAQAAARGLSRREFCCLASRLLYCPRSLPGGGVAAGKSDARRPARRP